MVWVGFVFINIINGFGGNVFSFSFDLYFVDHVLKCV